MPALAASNVPAWLTRTNNGPGSATFSGTPPLSAVGNVTIGLTATSIAGQATQDVTLSVEAIETDLDVTVSPNPAKYGQDSAATATVTSPVPGAVQFSVDGEDVGDPVPSVGGQATSPVLTDADGDPLSPNSYSIGAAFAPSAPGALPSDNSTMLVVQQAATQTSLEIVPGALQASVVAVAPGAGTPTGTVTFYLGDDPIDDAPLVGGEAELTFDVPSGQDAKVSAEYSGDDNFTSSSDSTVRRDPQIEASLTSMRPQTRFGWYGTPVKVHFTCTEGSARIDACPADVTLKTSDADAVVERTIHADDGGIATVVTHVQLDLDKPTVRVTGVRNGAVYPGKAPRPQCVATDRLSGVASCKVTREKVGERVRFRAVAADKAGNTATAKGRYRVLSNFVKGAPFRDRAFVVRAGQSYTFVAKSVKRPRYFFAAPWPTTPFERGPLMQRAGKHRWVQRISITDAMAVRDDWNVAIKAAGQLRVIRLHIR